jgi:type IV secretory pathway VirB10-like protein
MRRREALLQGTAAVLTLIAWTGCGEFDPMEPQARSAPPESTGVMIDDPFAAPPVKPKPKPKPPAEPAKAAEAPKAGEPSSSTPAPRSAPAARAQAPAKVAAPRPAVREPSSSGTAIRDKAAVGMGKKGHYGNGYLGTVLSTKWRVQEKLIFEIQIPDAMNKFRATHDRYPKDTKNSSERSSTRPISSCRSCPKDSPTFTTPTRVSFRWKVPRVKEQDFGTKQ